MVNPVFFFVPNLIGYGRILTCILSMHYATVNPYYTLLMYAISQGLDGVDGNAARALGQSSRFGALLDMLTDRMSTLCLMMAEAHMFPDYWQFFAFLCCLDIVSHWVQMYSKMLAGAKSHKDSGNPLLHFYYTFPYALLVFVLFDQAFILCMYLGYWTDAKYWWNIEVPTPWCSMFKSVPVLHFIAAFSLPIFLGKQFMNVVQLYDAAGEVAKKDLADRAPAAAEKTN